LEKAADTVEKNNRRAVETLQNLSTQLAAAEPRIAEEVRLVRKSARMAPQNIFGNPGKLYPRTLTTQSEH
jgi:hypothetical protein